MKLKYSVLIAGLMAVLFLGGCTRVDPGHVGIKVNLNGDNRGVSPDQIVTGRVTYNPFTTTIYTFPTFTQRFAWTKDPAEGSQNDESITFNSIEGASINIDVAFAAGFNDAAVPSLFEEFRRPAGEIVDGWVRDQVRNCLNEAGAKQQAVKILGAGKAEFTKATNDCVSSELAPKGFNNIELSMIGEARPSDTVRASIAQVIEATQKAIRAEAQVRTAEAEADKVAATADGEKRKLIAEAQGEAEARVARAQAEAQAISVKAQAQAEANRILAESLNQDLINYEATRRWNGVLPRFTGGGAVPFVNVDPSQE